MNGPAVGVGCTLCVHCDLVYAVDTAYFWAPFFRLALVPEFASSQLFAPLFGSGFGGTGFPVFLLLAM